MANKENVYKTIAQRDKNWEQQVSVKHVINFRGKVQMITKAVTRRFVRQMKSSNLQLSARDAQQKQNLIALKDSVTQLNVELERLSLQMDLVKNAQITRNHRPTKKNAKWLTAHLTKL